MANLCMMERAALTLMYWRASRALRAWPPAADHRPWRLRCHDAPMMPTKAIHILRVIANSPAEGRLSEAAANTLATLLIEKHERTRS